MVSQFIRTCIGLVHVYNKYAPCGTNVTHWCDFPLMDWCISNINAPVHFIK